MKTSPPAASLQLSKVPGSISGAAISKSGLRSSQRLTAIIPCISDKTASLMKSRSDRVSTGRRPQRPAGQKSQIIQFFYHFLRPLIEPQRLPQINQQAPTQSADNRGFLIASPYGNSAKLKRVCSRKARWKYVIRRRIDRRLSLLKTSPSFQSAAISSSPTGLEFDEPASATHEAGQFQIPLNHFQADCLTGRDVILGLNDAQENDFEETNDQFTEFLRILVQRL